LPHDSVSDAQIEHRQMRGQVRREAARGRPDRVGCAAGLPQFRAVGALVGSLVAARPGRRPISETVTAQFSGKLIWVPAVALAGAVNRPTR
jgi:hypothetical protein